MCKNVVALYGVPRSGTSWLGEILDSCPNVAFRFQPLFSYRFKNRITVESKKEDIKLFFKELYDEDKDEFLNQTEKRKKGEYPTFKKEESQTFILAYKEARYLYTIPIILKHCPEAKIISIVRNPYDVMESWINAPLEYKNSWDINEEWYWAPKKNEYKPENYYGYNKWKEAIKMSIDVQKMYPDNFKIVRYEDLVTDAVKVSKELFEFLGLPFLKQTEQFILESQSKTVDDGYSVYRAKGEKLERKKILPKDIKEMISKDLKDFNEAIMLGYC